MIKTPLSVILFMIFTSFCIAAPTDTNSVKIDSAISSAKSWLKLVDDEDFGASWDRASSLFKNQIKKEYWISTIAGLKSSLGKTIDRKLSGAKYTKTLPRIPSGEYVVIRYMTSFANKENAVETITPMKDHGGIWRVSGYFIK